MPKEASMIENCCSAIEHTWSMNNCDFFETEIRDGGGPRKTLFGHQHQRTYRQSMLEFREVDEKYWKKLLLNVEHNWNLIVWNRFHSNICYGRLNSGLTSSVIFKMTRKISWNRTFHTCFTFILNIIAWKYELRSPNDSLLTPFLTSRWGSTVSKIISAKLKGNWLQRTQNCHGSFF